ncbi:proton-coupled folate transporter-like [Oratosquilla oratoria]|uniref:proton-coupled folate transporter-like n=1 Tax=Oratosquilla oratoria TaxID=337810 RepID=UPI003F7734A9
MPAHTVEIPTFIYYFCYGIFILTVQSLVVERECEQQGVDKVICANLANVPEEFQEQVKIAQGKSTRYITGFNVVLTLASVTSSQVFGAWMDRYSRKLLLLFGIVAQLLTVILVACFAAFPSLPMEVAFLIAGFYGFLGAVVLFKSTIYSYMLSVVPVEKRTLRLGVLEAMVYLGAALGLICVNLVISYLTTDKTWILTGIACLVALNAIISVIFVKDYSINCQTDENSHKGLCRAFIDKFTASISATFRKREGLRGFIITVVILDFLSSFIIPCDVDISIVYVQSSVHCSFDRFLEIYTVKSLLEGASLVVVLPLLRRFVNCRNTTLGVLGALSRAGYFIIIGIISKCSLVYWALLLGPFGQYLFVVHRAVVSRLVEENEQGRLMTFMATVEQLGIMLGSLFFGNVYPLTVNMDMPGLLFVIAGVLALVPGVVYGVFHFILPFDKTPSDRVKKDDEEVREEISKFATRHQQDEERKPLLRSPFDP